MEIQRTVSLRDLCNELSQKEVAKLMRVTQGAIHLMLKDERDIYAMQDTNGIYVDFIEIKHLLK